MYKRGNKIKPFTIMVILSCMILASIISCTLIYSKNSKSKITYPKPTDMMYINDYAGIIDDNIKNQIVSLGKELQDKTTAQAAVVVIKSLNGENIDKYANGLFNEWGIGQKDSNNGLLILIAIEDKKWRVEVGSGLEKAISNKHSSDVMNDVAKPYFKDSLYGPGLRKVYSIFTADIANNYGVRLDNGENTEYNYTPRNSTNSNSNFGGIALAIVVIIIFMLMMTKKTGKGGSYYHSGSNSGWFDASSDSGSGDSGGFDGGSSDGGGSSGDW